MKKTIFAISLIAGLASCGGNQVKKETVRADSTAVAVDTTKVDSVATK